MPSWKGLLIRHAGTAALVLMLTLSLGLNIYLAQRVRVGAPSTPPPLLKVDAILEDRLVLENVNGMPVSLAFSDDQRPTVLYVLSPHCGWCTRNELNMKSLVAQVGSRYRFVGLSTTSKDLREYIENERAPFPVFFVRSKDLIEKMSLYGTPQTIVVSTSGKVEHVWRGAYVQNSQKAIEDFFQVKLPGLQEVAAGGTQ